MPAYFLVVGLCSSFYLLQKPAYLMVAELDTDLQAQLNIGSNHLLAPFCSRTLFCFLLCLCPERTSFFQALDIITKISRGNIQILSNVKLIKTGDKVGASEATLLHMLSIPLLLWTDHPACDLQVYNLEVHDITEQTLHSRFSFSAYWNRSLW